MSADLKLFQDLSNIMAPAAIKIPPRVESAATTEGVQLEECRTPTSAEHKIPAVLSCPPAPRKPRRTRKCKRKLSAELEFFEIANRREVEDFFRSSFNIVAKRKCPCT